MGFFQQLVRNFINRNSRQYGDPYEFCPRCDANLTLQKGYSNEYPYWICKGCGEMLINPAVDAEDDIAWICDECSAMLNIQEGFSTDCGCWKCTECGFENKIDSSEIYVTEDEYQAALRDPYKGMHDADVVSLLKYEEIAHINDRPDISLVVDEDEEMMFLKKIRRVDDVTLYKYLSDNPISNMPKIIEVYEGERNLVVIEDYIKGKTLSEVLHEGPIEQKKVIDISIQICEALKELHHLSKPIVHRDIKPSNIIISETGEAYLLDMDVAKWIKPDETEDTKLLGTLYFAAPEQFGYGFSSSSDKSDVYAMGILLNVMITGKIPKEKKADGPVWDVIERCICLEPEQRYTDTELIDALENLVR